MLSKTPFDNCLERVRAHIRDLEAGEEFVPDVKVLILGNGRIGKTQICRRLRGEAFEGNAESTHGIRVNSARLPMAPPDSDVARLRRTKKSRSPAPADEATLHLWDFGGQDLYHGTHALFMRARSVFIVVWTPQFEETQKYERDGITFSNHPLPYWVEFIRHLSGTEGPILIVQNMCERPKDEVLHPPVQADSLKQFGFCKILHYSALEDRGRPALDDALKEAILWLRER